MTPLRIEVARDQPSVDGASNVLLTVFEGEANARLGRRYARAFLEPFAADTARSLLVARHGSRIAGLAAGGPSRQEAQRYRCLRLAAGRALLGRPWLLLDQAILGMAAARWRGAAPVAEDVWFLALLGVGTADRGRGIGAALLTAFEREGRSRGFTRATLLVRDANATARCFYERRGWMLGGDAPRGRVRYGRLLDEG